MPHAKETSGGRFAGHGSADSLRGVSDSKKSKKKGPGIDQVWRESRELIVQHRKPLSIGLGLLVVSRAASLVLPFTSKTLIDDVIGKRNVDLLVPLAIVAGCATLVQALTGYALAQVVSITAQGAITDMRKKVMAHVTRLPVRYFDSTQTGILISRIMTDAEGIRNLVGTGLVQLIGGFMTASVALVVLLYLNWHLTLVTLAVLAVFSVFMTWVFQRFRPLFRERGKINAEVTGRLAETLGGVRIVKAYTAEPREQKVFAGGADRLFKNVAESITAVSGTQAFSVVIVGVIGVIMMLVGGRSILAGDMTVGGFVMYLAFTGMLAGPLVEIANIGTQITEAFAGLDRIRELQAMAEESEGDDQRAPLQSLRGDITYEDVTFEYNPGVPVLKNISFNAPAGSTTALVGSSGSGKSTLISLAMAFNRPKSGRILLDGRDLGTVPLAGYRANLGVVLQDNFLFDGTIAENIAFSRPDAPLERIREVSHIAHCDEFIEKFEKGYDTVVGERGVRLSGGQRQRVAIARAILADPRILILDEATSSLDSESEALIQDGLRALMKGRTTFVIAHRLSTIRGADQILVLEGGEIVERGRHEQLMEKDGRYRELHDRQYKIELNRFINPGEDFIPVPERAKAISEVETAAPPRG
jgi:subfamily B ATP-binding cassette protein MsbA